MLGGSLIGAYSLSGAAGRLGRGGAGLQGGAVPAEPTARDGSPGTKAWIT